MKLYRNAIILVVVLGLLAGAYFFINSKKPKNADTASEDTAQNSINVITADRDKINLLEYSNENGKFSLKKQGDNWVMDPTSEFAVDGSIAETACGDLSTVVANKVIEEKATDLAKYGLDKPATVKIGLTDGTSKEIEIGSLSPTNEGIYVKNKGESKVYLIGTYYLDKLKLTRGYFATKGFLTADPQGIKSFAYEKNGQMQYSFDTSDQAAVKILAPIEDEADPTKVSQMLESVVKLTIKDIVDENPDLAKYGLDKPAFALTVGDGTDTKKILFGKDEVKGSSVYAKFDNKKSVFTIDTSSLTFLDVKLKDVVSPFVYIPSINNVNKIELTIDGKTIVSDIKTVEGKTEEDKFKVDGKDANMKDEGSNSYFRAFYQAMIGVTLNKYETGIKPTGKSEITIKYYMKPDNKPVTIEYISKDNNYYYAMKDGVYTNRTVLKSQFDAVDGIRDAYKKLKEAIDKAK
jgi:hypothetical protein